MNRCVILAVLVLLLTSVVLQAQEQMPEEVAAVFREHCIQCHNSRSAPLGLILEPDAVYANTVRKRSTEKSEYFRVAPGDSASSYLMMKLVGAKNIEGQSMPPIGRLSQGNIQTIAKWIWSLPKNAEPIIKSSTPPGSFISWNIGDLPTAVVLGRGTMLFTISHRFAPKVDEGYKAFYGLDGPAVMMLGFDYPVTDSFMAGIGRSNGQDNLEVRGRYRFFREEEGGTPLSLAAQAVLNWKWHVRGDRNSTAYTLQIIGTRSLLERTALAAVPGITFNPDPFEGGEDPLVSLGLGGKVRVAEGFSVFGQVTPVLSGFPGVRPIYGLYDTVKRYDTWSVGVEANVSVHVFQIFLTNSQGIAMDNYLTGGDIDVTKGDVRLGFTIFSIK